MIYSRESFSKSRLTRPRGWLNRGLCAVRSPLSAALEASAHRQALLGEPASIAITNPQVEKACLSDRCRCAVGRKPAARRI